MYETVIDLYTYDFEINLHLSDKVAQKLSKHFDFELPYSTSSLTIAKCIIQYIIRHIDPFIFELSELNELTIVELHLNECSKIKYMAINIENKLESEK